MQPRTLALALALFLLVAGPAGARPQQAVRPADRESIRSQHELPLPFLGSGGVLVQAPALQPAPPLGLLRSRDAHGGALPGQPGAAGTTEVAGEVRQYLVAGREAYLLGTPPPLPRSGPGARPADSNAPA